jgi:hypothetical protein
MSASACSGACAPLAVLFCVLWHPEQLARSSGYTVASNAFSDRALSNPISFV